MNAKVKGTRNERRSIAIFEAAGYEVIRSAGSGGIWDFMAWNEHEIVFVQVKTRDWPSAVEMEQLQRSKCPSFARKLIHRWRDGNRMPDVRELK